MDSRHTGIFASSTNAEVMDWESVLEDDYKSNKLMGMKGEITYKGRDNKNIKNIIRQQRGIVFVVKTALSEI